MILRQSVQYYSSFTKSVQIPEGKTIGKKKQIVHYIAYDVRVYMLHALVCYRNGIKREDLEVTMLVTKGWRGTLLVLHVPFVQAVRASQVANVHPLQVLFP